MTRLPTRPHGRGGDRADLRRRAPCPAVVRFLDPCEPAELSPRTFCTLPREFSPFTQGAAHGQPLDPGHGSAGLLVQSRGPVLPAVGFRRTGLRVAVVGRAVSTRSSCGRVE